MTEQKLKTFCEKRPEIEFAYLYGSQASKQAGPLSDMDFAFYLDFNLVDLSTQLDYPANLTADLCRHFETNSLDAAILNEAPILLRWEVIHSGVPLYSKDENKRLEFHVKTFNLFQDWKHFLKTQQNYLLDRIQKGEFGK